MNLNRLRNSGIAFVFLSLIGFPLINENFGLIKDIKSFENRKMSPKPKFDVKHLDQFPTPYETYYNDTFSLRSRLIKSFNLFTVGAFDKSPYPEKLIIGKNKWLFMAGDEINCYLGKNPLSLEEMEKLRKEFEYRTKIYDSLGAKFYVLVAPNKATIYSNKVPYNFYKINAQSWGEQLISYLIQHNFKNTVNVFPQFKLKSKTEILHRKLDNHWNNLGAFYAAQQVTQTLSKDFSDVSILMRDRMTVEEIALPEGNIKQILGDDFYFYQKDTDFEVKPLSGFKATRSPNQAYKVPAGFPYHWLYESHLNNKHSNKRSLLIISDSFGEAIFPFLGESFENTTKIWDSWDYGINVEIVAKEKPDAVVLIIHEALIRNILAHLSYLKN